MSKIPRILPDYPEFRIPNCNSNSLPDVLGEKARSGDTRSMSSIDRLSGGAMFVRYPSENGCGQSPSHLMTKRVRGKVPNSARPAKGCN